MRSLQKGRREHSEIILEVMALCATGHYGITAIMYRAYLSFFQGHKYLDALQSLGFVVRNAKLHYQLTVTGQVMYSQLQDAVEVCRKVRAGP